MIGTRNGYIGCEPLQEIVQETVETPGFKGRDVQRGLCWTTVVYGTNDYSPGTKVWLKRAFGMQPYEEYQFNNRTIVMVRALDVLFAETNPPALGATAGCSSAYHKNFIKCPYCSP